MVDDERFGDPDGWYPEEIILDLANNEIVTAIEYREVRDIWWNDCDHKGGCWLDEGLTCGFSIFTSSNIEANKQYGPFATEDCTAEVTEQFYLEVPLYYNFGQFIAKIFYSNNEGWFGIDYDRAISL